MVVNTPQWFVLDSSMSQRLSGLHRKPPFQNSQCYSKPVVVICICFTGAQLEIFQGRGCIVEFGHFDKDFVKKHKKRKLRREKFWNFFLLDTLKTTFWMENLTQRWIQPRPSFQNQGTFFNFQKRAGEASPLPTLAARLLHSYGRLHISKSFQASFNPFSNSCLSKIRVKI